MNEALANYYKLRANWVNRPVLYAQQRLGFNPTWQQKDILNSLVPSGSKVTVRSGHGIGKTGATAIALFWFLETRKHVRLPCTAPTASQLRDVLWAELAKIQRLSDEKSLANGLPQELWLSSFFEITRDRVVVPAASGEWYAVARTSGRNNPDALQGFHASNAVVSDDGSKLVKSDADDDGHIMFIIDEASGVFEKVFEVAEGALSSPGARLLMLGNPTKNNGSFADSHVKNRGSFTALHFKTMDSPLADPNYRNNLVKKYGEGSNVVRVRADGEFPKQDDDVLIPFEACEAAITAEALPSDDEIRLGVDVARFGDDRTVFVVRQGRNILYVQIIAKSDTMNTAGIAKTIRNRFDCCAIYVDVIGVGGGVVDRLNEQGENVVAVNVSLAAPKREKHDEQGIKMRDYIWLEMANWMKNKAPSFAGVDPQIANDLAAELATVKYSFDSDGRIKVEGKDAMKKRLGSSPDIADALGCTFGDSGQEIYIG